MLITRFAPAPTGHLHLGHVVNACYVWEAAHRRGGRVLLRLEDHDRQRSRPEYESSILEDLDWLGFVADAPLVRQSERGDIYERALATLQAEGAVYACECSRRDLGDTLDPGAEARYPGTCAAKGLADAPGRSLRVRLDAREERFDDLLQGAQRQRPSAQCGDMVIRDRHGNWTYQFAVTVDDFEQGVTDVIRGVDLLASTGRQIKLARMLGREIPPTFMHHALIMKSASQKLSKSDGDSGVRDLRAAGKTAVEVKALARGLVEG